MPQYALNFFEISQISTSNVSGFNDNGGYQFALGTDTVTLTNGATFREVLVEDTTNTYFDDDAGLEQTLAADYTLDGAFYTTGTIIESEYVLNVEGAGGQTYILQFISLANDAFTIHGFVPQGLKPPDGVPLTVVGRYDGSYGINAYSSMWPPCFGPRSRILLADGRWRAAARLNGGEQLRLFDGGTARLDLVLRSPANSAMRPIRFRADALGPGRPVRGLLLSAQHRVWLPDLDALVPARALTAWPRIGPAPASAADPLIHLVTRRHALVVAEGLACETFWPGPQAMAGLSPASRQAVRRLMGPDPKPARPLLSMRDARRLLHDTPPRDTHTKRNPP